MINIESEGRKLGEMGALLTAAQMRAREQAAISEGRVTGLALMERAGEGVVAATLAHWPELRSGSRRAVVLCGPGNNGGDGFVVARLLQSRGWDVRVLFFGTSEKLPPDARINHDRWAACGQVHATETFAGGLRVEAGAMDPGQAPPDLYVDALFGTGLTRALPEHLRETYLRRLSGADSKGTCIRHGGRLVAIDIPSGLCADSGRVLLPSEQDAGAVAGPADVGRPDLTVTFHAPKLGHVLAQGSGACGALVCVDIGLSAGPEDPMEVRLVAPDRRTDGLTGAAREIDIVDKAARGPEPCTHKFAHGHALCLTGGMGRTGAGRLAARAALRVGAGLVTLGMPPSAQLEVACHITTEMMTRVETGSDLQTVFSDPRFTALCLGPGLGLERAQDLVLAALHVSAGTSASEAGMRRGVVLDADALSAFSDAPGTLFEKLHPGCVLTPHGGEFARLFPDLAEKLAVPAMRGPAFSKVDAARAAAARAGCVLLLKGPDTVIAGPEGHAAVHAALYERTAPWLATAGAGDVLAGIICGLLARRIAPMQAARIGAWLHVEAARTFGPGLIAEDLPDQIPRVLDNLAL